MKKQTINLRKLVKLKILQIVEPSENLKNSYLQKSDDSLKSAKILSTNGQYADAIALSYFSMYYSVLALFYLIGVKSENHNASIFLLKRIFDIDNEVIKKAKFERKDKQYYPNFAVSEKEVLDALISAEDFNAEILNFITGLTFKDRDSYFKKAKDFLEIY
ncbi:MAG: HEPN protein [archaeon GW2011_AR19]|nr:MAG: HEPN protein [archaeon GW2011_AR19]